LSDAPARAARRRGAIDIKITLLIFSTPLKVGASASGVLPRKFAGYGELQFRDTGANAAAQPK